MRLLIALAVFAVFPAGIFAQSLQEAQKEIDNEHYYKAKVILFKLMSDGSVNKSDVAYYLGNAYLKADDADSAKLFYKMVSGTDSKYFYGNLAAGRLAILAKDKAGAQTNFERALQTTKYKNALVFFEVGDAWLRPTVTDVNAAIKNLEEAYNLDSKNCAIMLELGDAYLENSGGDNTMGGKAMTKYESASDLCKNNALAWVKQGRLAMAGRIYDQAKDAFKKAVQIDPNNPIVHKELGEAYYKTRAFDTMITEFKKYLELSPGDAKARGIILKIYFENKDYDKCAEEAAKGLKTEPNNLDYFRYEIYSYYELKRFQDANEAIRKFWQTPGLVAKQTDYVYSARIANAVGDTTQALGYFKSALQNDSTNCDLLSEYIKVVYQQLKHYDEAVGLYNSKKAKCGLTSLDIYYLGRCYSLTGDSLMADTTFGEFIAKNPTSPDGYFQRARVNLKIGKQEDWNAYQYYAKYIDLAPDPAKYKGNLVEAYDYLGLYYADKEKNLSKGMEYLNKALGLDPNDENTKNFIDAIKKAK